MDRRGGGGDDPRQRSRKVHRHVPLLEIPLKKDFLLAFLLHSYHPTHTRSLSLSLSLARALSLLFVPRLRFCSLFAHLLCSREALYNIVVQFDRSYRAIYY